MMQESDIAFELYHYNPYTRMHQILSNSGDIILTKLNQIQRLIQKFGIISNKTMQNAIYSMFQMSVLMGLPLFYYNWYNANTANSLYPTEWIFFFNLILTNINVFAYSSQSAQTEYVVTKHLPSLFISSQRFKIVWVRNFVIKVFAQCVLQSLAIYYITIYTIYEQTIQNGKNSDFQLTSITIIVSIIIVANLQTLIQNFKPVTCALTLVSLGLQVAFFYVYDKGQWGVYIQKKSFETVLSQGESIFTIIVNVVACLFFDYFITNVIFQRLLPSIYQEFQNDEGLRDFDEFHNNLVREKSARSTDIGKQIKQIF